MTPEEKKALAEQIGKEATEAVNKQLVAYEAKAKEFAETVAKGNITKEAFETYQSAAKEALESVKSICEKQGTTINTILSKLNTSEVGVKSIGEVLEGEEAELKKVFQNGSGTKTYMVQINAKGEFVMKPFDTTAKAAGPHATTANVGTVGNTSSIAQSIDAASLLRLGGDSPIISQYRNSSWVFDLCNIVNAGFEMPFAMWYEEVAKQGASATTAEGVSKAITQYAYTLKTASYKKEATLIGFTEEFALDFARLQSDILGKGRTDVINRINTAVLANIITAATAYNTSTSYKNGAALGAGTYNDFITIDALAAQVDSNTFGSMANSAVMSTYKKHRLGVTMDSQGRFINTPDFLANVAMVGNPAMGVDDILVGDFKQYNIILRGGFLVKIGYNGTDFAENRFSVVLEQFYYDYISSIRAAAIVKGTTFAAVKTALTT